MQRSISKFSVPVLLGVLLATAGCRKQQQAEAGQNPATAEQRPASEQVAGARTEGEAEADDTKPEQILNDANALLSGIQDPVHQAALKQYASQARGVFVFPNVRKAAFLVGGRGGRGVLLARQSDGKFGSPAFFSLGGGSVGLQIGYERSSVMLFVTNEKALRSAMNGGFQLGSGASVAVGTMTESGRSAEGTAGADIISVVLDNDGVFAGASVNGALLEPQERLNREHYGSTDAMTITTTNRFMQSHAASITDTLNRLAPPSAQGQSQSDSSQTGSMARDTQQSSSPTAQGTQRAQGTQATQGPQRTPSQTNQRPQGTQGAQTTGTQAPRPTNP